jgi:alpha-galactosidase
VLGASASRAAFAAYTILTILTLACTPRARDTSPHPAPAVVGLAPTPPMGWNSRVKFGCQIDEQSVRETADAMVSSGMRDAGYRYVNLDDCWMANTRDPNGHLRPDPARFPGGMKALADYIHSKGLKFGIYSSAGTITCQRLPGSLDYELVDARTFASWEIDYLKYDDCGGQGRPVLARYRAMSEAIRTTGRPIVFSICDRGQNNPWEWGIDAGAHLWRISGDMSDLFSSVVRSIDRQVLAGLDKYSGPNAWNDPDVLEAGNGRMSNAEYIAQFSLWALLNAPLLSGTDVRAMSDSTRMILMNREVIAVDQDWAGRQGTKLRRDRDTEIWTKPMSTGATAVLLLNRGSAPAIITVTTDELGFRRGALSRMLGIAGHYRARDLWTHTDLTAHGKVAATVGAYTAAMYIIYP